MKFKVLVSAPASHRRNVTRAAKKTLTAIPTRVLKKLKTNESYTFEISFVTPSEMKKLNARYRKKNKPTDVLTFTRFEDRTYRFFQNHLGDILICLQVARRQAKEYETSLKEELDRLTVHGVLHLFGYDHEISKKEEKRMFRLQEEILLQLRT